MEFQNAIDYILGRLESELPENLHYHGHHHTIAIMDSSRMIGEAEGISEMEMQLLLVATAYHDCGFLVEYSDHEKHGCDLAEEFLPDFGFNEDQIEQIKRMIMATKVPQEPKDKLSRILCDADLDYLGTDMFSEIGDSLFEELISINALETREQWDRIQLKFLRAHKYHTDFGIKNRQPVKEKHIVRLERLLSE